DAAKRFPCGAGAEIFAANKTLYDSLVVYDTVELGEWYLLSAAIPTTVNQSPHARILDPIGLRPAKNRRANAWVTIATRNELSSSCSVKSRPSTMGICKAAK